MSIEIQGARHDLGYLQGVPSDLDHLYDPAPLAHLSNHANLAPPKFRGVAEVSLKKQDFSVCKIKGQFLGQGLFLVLVYTAL